MFKFCSDEVAAGGFDAVDGLNLTVVSLIGSTSYGNQDRWTKHANSSSSSMGISTLASHHPLRSL